MSRRKRVLKRPTILPDKNFGSILVTRLINRVMWDGKKTIATKIVTTALTSASEELKLEPAELLEIVIDNIQPKIIVQSMRVGGANYQVPVEPRAELALRLGLTWLVNGARTMKGKPMDQKLKQIIVDSYNGQGSAVAKRNSVHQTAAGNKAFTHLAYRGQKKK
jgi:small subunit ribosomal protein S7